MWISSGIGPFQEHALAGRYTDLIRHATEISLRAEGHVARILDDTALNGEIKERAQIDASVKRGHQSDVNIAPRRGWVALFR